jgi:hypothetical protein
VTELRDRARNAEATEIHPYERFYAAFERRRRQAEVGRIVIRAQDLPFQTSRQGTSKYYLQLGGEDTALQDWQVFQKDVETESGKHIHQGGLIIYVLRGRGYSVFDGVRLDWEAGDLLSLPVQPGGVEHQHFNLDESESSRWVAFIYIPFLHATGSMMKQVEGDVGRQGVKSAPGSVSTGENSLFDSFLADASAERRRRALGKNLIRHSDCPVELNAMGKMRWYLHPRLAEPSTRALYFHELEIPGGSRSGRLHCQGGIVHLVVAGVGYTVVDGVRHDWEAEDVIAIPIREEGVTYQHFNTGTAPARLMVAWPNLDSALGPEGGVAIELQESAPEPDAVATQP